MARKPAPKTVNVHEAKTHLSRLLSRVQRGEEVIIAKAGRPIARLLPFEAKPAVPRFGVDRGRFVVPEDFNVLPDEILDTFHR
jgi:prevent-host-death family protein